MIRPLLGIVVTTTQNGNEKHKENGRSVLFALHQVSRLFQCDVLYERWTQSGRI